MLPSTRARVRERAGNACEYCHLHQDDSPLAVLHIEHIIPKIHGGNDDLDNLALACIDCNLHKGPNLTGIDPETGAVTGTISPKTSCLGRSFCAEGNPSGQQHANRQSYNSRPQHELEDQLALRSS